MAFPEKRLLPPARESGSVTLVSRCYRYAAIVLLVLWVPAALHCRLELIPAVSFLSCCQHPEKDKTPAHHDDDCSNDGGAAFESGLYHLEKTPEMFLIPAGEFKMGNGESAEDTAAFFRKTYGEDSLKAEYFKSEHPQHRVRITKPF